MCILSSHRGGMEKGQERTQKRVCLLVPQYPSRCQHVPDCWNWVTGKSLLLPGTDTELDLFIPLTGCKPYPGLVLNPACPVLVIQTQIAWGQRRSRLKAPCWVLYGSSLKIRHMAAFYATSLPAWLTPICVGGSLWISCCFKVGTLPGVPSLWKSPTHSLMSRMSRMERWIYRKDKALEDQSQQCSRGVKKHLLVLLSR